MITIDLQGMAQVTQNLQRLVTVPQAPLEDALVHEAQAILDVSRQLCPVDTGALVSSGEVETPQHVGTLTEVTIRYGDHGRVPYAMVQEFDVTFNHPHGGQAHFLQQPLFAATAGFAGRIAGALQGTLR